MTVEVFGTMPDGASVQRATITGGGLTAKILTFGAVLQDLRLDGHDKALVLGFEDLQSYLTKSSHHGANAGRVANRIEGASFELDGKVYKLDVNNLGKHTLHGGTVGVGVRNWTLDKVESNAVHLSIKLADGEMGFPGNMNVQLIYRLLEDGVLDIEIKATTDAPTLCNIVHHSYFNLDGSDTILDHTLQVNADRYTVPDDELILTGEIASVEGTHLDFRTAKTIRSASEVKPIDNNLCCEEGAGTLRKLATLASAKSGVSMDVLSTEPGLQIFDAYPIRPGVPGLDGANMDEWAGFCLEPQVWPNAANCPNFPQSVLRPDETYRQQTQYVFSKN